MVLPAHRVSVHRSPADTLANGRAATAQHRAPFDAVGYSWLMFPNPADTDGAVCVGLGSTATYASDRRGSARSCGGAARLHGRVYPSGSDTAARCIRRRRLHRASGSAILGYVRRCIRAARQQQRCVAAAVDCVRQRSRGARIHWACVSAVGGFTHVLYPSTVVIHSSVSEFRGNTIEVTEVCDRGERGGGMRARRARARIIFYF
jgi:hypothetical protein